MDTLPSLRRLPWLPGTFLITLAAMIAVIIISTNTLRTVLAVGAMIMLSLGGGILTYTRNKNRRFFPAGTPGGSDFSYAPGNPYATTEVLRPVPRYTQPPRWPRLQALMRAAPLFGVGLAFCFNYKVAADLFSGKSVTSLHGIIAVTLLALGFALGLATRPYAIRQDRPTWLAWMAFAIVVTEWLTLFMLFTATFDGNYRSAIAPALLALGAVLPLISTARELTNRRYEAQVAGVTFSGRNAQPSRMRALWRSGGARLVVGAVGLAALAAYMLVAAPTLTGPSVVARVWPIALTILCVLIPRGKGEEDSPEVTAV
jgi:hypothetical protein